MNRLIVVLLLAPAWATTYSAPAKADISSGNDLYYACTEDSPASKLKCLSLVSGFLDGQSAGYTRAIFHVVAATCSSCKGRDDPEFQKRVTDVLRHLKEDGAETAQCLPVQGTVGQAVDIVVKWLRDNPEKRAKGIGYVINTALVEAFGYPCNGESGKP